MFEKKDLLKDHVRERFYVTPGHDVPPFTGILLNVAKANLEFGDVRVENHQVEGTLFVERHPGLYLQRVNDATG
ncbi:hypothetical protein FDI14_gp009 [Mycobacterium phage SirDuracell]|uniref:Uncharacterized protein n=23 Tax=Viruses TaxID=10239 RepID=Q858A2_9CAUD|nr:gp9 [Mycobacterium phage Cjw1]YP_002014329.1 hypothetical protein Porky_8 [Mycobacterium phage Porky]YP_008051488.1 hypothetical protein PBI_MURPHY_9 [Mycobacterium phage Murphy]YP_008051634.1 hypothetical protein PBI_DUMBO_9 [Mycobacterium phage Dumbo]YP_008051945.1 hypothetical protein PBI_PHRUX_9 [Mycobacterium phage Phrux]YP_008052182.1 hypothetical protein M039_gp008 [Mycobacterium phage Phaux]YP_008409403.1 hypothetical protein DRDREY_10 [Mycobacterium phage DrDrey]YP_008410027.1 hy